jgi:hypothetical protein
MNLLADLVLLMHGAFIVFVMLGGLLVLRWGILIELTGWICPLTPLENRLREAAGLDSYGESFIEHYLMPLIYPPGLTPGIQYQLAATVLLVNLLIYFLVWRHRH